MSFVTAPAVSHSTFAASPLVPFELVESRAIMWLGHGYRYTYAFNLQAENMSLNASHL
jgi:hypothetical protein